MCHLLVLYNFASRNKTELVEVSKHFADLLQEDKKLADWLQVGEKLADCLPVGIFQHISSCSFTWSSY